MLSEEIFFMCPYCWQRISMIFEKNQVMLDYIEDCEVCCRPISINYKPRESTEGEVDVSRLDD